MAQIRSSEIGTLKIRSGKIESAQIESPQTGPRQVRRHVPFRPPCIPCSSPAPAVSSFEAFPTPASVQPLAQCLAGIRKPLTIADPPSPYEQRKARPNAVLCAGLGRRAMPRQRHTMSAWSYRGRSATKPDDHPGGRHGSAEWSIGRLFVAKEHARERLRVRTPGRVQRDALRLQSC